MPRSAIATGMIDWVLRVADMPERLLKYRGQARRLKLPPEDGPQPARPVRAATSDGEAALRDVLTHLRTRTGRDFSYYKRATIVRRVARRMQVNGVEDMPEYLTFLRTHAGEAGALLQDLLISVTNFFRDRDAFDALEQRIPDLFKDSSPSDQVRVWVPACATGEEAYSVAMFLAEHARAVDRPPQLQIFATDLDEEVIRVARDGIYPETIAADVSDERMRRFFAKEHRGYRVRREIRESVLFAVHDLLKDAPFSKIDLISCRNLLIYLDRDAQKRAFETFHFALRPHGLLFLGLSESAEDCGDLFSIVDKKHRIYTHRPTARILLPVPIGPSTLTLALQTQEAMKERPTMPPVARLPEAETPLLTARQAQAERAASLSELHFKLLERFGPPSVVVNQHHDIVHLSNSAGRFLQLSGGELTRNLLRAVHPMLRLELRAALYRTAQTSEVAQASAVPVDLNGKRYAVDMHVAPAGDIAPDFMLVTFDAKPVAAAAAHDETPAVIDPLAPELEREIEHLKSTLRDTVEQHEASTEELKASNEELQAMNEELRSASEELESSREELQSINEELTTVNYELKNKIDELGHANSDLHNLMASTSIATVFLDRDLRIMRFTPSAVSRFNLIAGDVGRPLVNLQPQLPYPQLASDAAAVIQRLIPIDRVVRDEHGRWYLARLLPYRTLDDHIGGVVLNFVDITERKQVEEKLRLSQERRELALQAAEMGAWEYDLVADVCHFDARAQEMYGLPSDALDYRPEGVAAVVHPDDVGPMFDTIQHASNVNGDGRYDIDYRIAQRDGRYRWLRAWGKAEFEGEGAARRAVRIVGASRDITVEKEAERRLTAELAATKQLQAVSTKLISEQEPDALYAQLLDAAMTLMNADAASLQRLDPERPRLSLIASRNLHPDSEVFWQWVDASSGSSCGNALETNTRVLVEDIERSAEIAGTQDVDEYRRSGLRAVQSTPLVSRDGRQLGMFSTAWRTPHQPSSADFQLFDVLARQAADLIERTQAQQTLREEFRNTQILHDLGARLVSAESIQAIYEEILSAAISITRAKAGTVHVRDVEKAELVVLATRGFSRRTEEHFHRVDARSTTSCGLALRTGTRAYVYFDPASTDVSDRLHVGDGVQSAQSTPLVSRSGKAIGMVSTHWGEANHRPSERELRYLDLLVRQAADLIEQRAADQAMRESDERNALLVRFSDAALGLSDPALVAETACRMLNQQLGTNRAVWARIDWAAREYVGEWAFLADGTRAEASRWPLDSAQPFVAEHLAGRTVAYDDTESDARIPAGARAAMAARGIRAGIAVPVMVDGTLRAVFNASQPAARHWHAREIATAEALAGRAWAEVERARAEQALRKSEERQAFLLALSDALRPLTDPVAVQTTAMRLLAERLDVMRASYFELEEDGDTFHLTARFERNATPMPERMRLTDFSPALAAAYRSGRTLSVADTNVLGEFVEDPKPYADIGVRAWAAVPLMREGRLAAWIGVHANAIREWSATDLQALNDVAERTWGAVERAQAEAALRASESRLMIELADTQVLQQASSILIEEDDIAALYSRLLVAACAIMRCDMASIQMFVPDRNELVLLAHQGFLPDSAAHWERVNVLTDAGTSCGRSLAAGERVVIPDVEIDEGAAGTVDLDNFRRCGIRAVQSTPLISRAGHFVGMISTHWRRVHQPSARELGMLDVLARQMADVIERRGSEAALRASEEKFRTVFESIDEGFNIHEVIRDDAGKAVDYRLLEANAAYTRMTGLSRDTIGKLGSEYMPDVEGYWLEAMDRVSRSGVAERAEMYNAPTGRWYNMQVTRVAGHPNRLAIVFDDVTARKEAELALKASEERQAFLLRLTDALRPLGDALEIKATACGVLGEALQVNRAFYAEVEGDDWMVTRHYEQRVAPLQDGAHSAATYGRWIMETYREGERIVFRDMRSDPRFLPAEREAHAAAGIISAVGIPLVKNGRLSAILAVHCTAPHQWTDEEIGLIDETAERTWAAVERANAEAALRVSEERLRRLNEQLEERVGERTSQVRSLFERLVSAQEEERRRIARDIHDQVGQQMTALRMNLETLRSQAAGSTLLVEQAERTQRLAEELDRSIDFLTWQLRPAALDHLGLSAALQNLAAGWSERFSVAAKLVVDGVEDVRLSRDVEANLYRIAQEALHNIAKHASATQVTLYLGQQNGNLVLLIEDDGRGFDPSADRQADGGSGMGLISMRERAALVGGRLEIESAGDRGTSIYVRIPRLE